MTKVFTPPLAVIIQFLLLPFLLIFILVIALILRFKKPHKFVNKTEFKRTTIIAMIIGGVIGGLYGICPWIASVFGSLEILGFFSFSNVTILIFDEMLGLKNYILSSGLSIVLWVVLGILYALMINKIRIKKGKQRHE